VGGGGGGGFLLSEGLGEAFSLRRGWGRLLL